MKSLAPSYIKGLTLLGGEPMEPVNQHGLIGFIRRVKAEFPEKDIWCYSGYTLRGDKKRQGAHRNNGRAFKPYGCFGGRRIC